MKNLELFYDYSIFEISWSNQNQKYEFCFFFSDYCPKVIFAQILFCFDISRATLQKIHSFCCRECIFFSDMKLIWSKKGKWQFYLKLNSIHNRINNCISKREHFHLFISIQIRKYFKSSRRITSTYIFLKLSFHYTLHLLPWILTQSKSYSSVDF